MKRLIRGCCVAMFVVVSTAYADAPSGYPFIPFEDALKRAHQQGKKVFVYFGRHGCGWCEKMNKEVFSVPAIRSRYTDHFVLVYIDTESGRRLKLPDGERITEMELAARHRIIATPMFAFLEADGKLIFKISGLQSVKDFEDYDRYVHDGHYRRQGLREYLTVPK
jgi:thioredoxin-related protein